MSFQQEDEAKRAIQQQKARDRRNMNIAIRNGRRYRRSPQYKKDKENQIKEKKKFLIFIKQILFLIIILLIVILIKYLINK
jgi:hypothetical protein